MYIHFRSVGPAKRLRQVSERVTALRRCFVDEQFELTAENVIKQEVLFFQLQYSEAKM